MSSSAPDLRSTSESVPDESLPFFHQSGAVTKMIVVLAVAACAMALYQTHALFEIVRRTQPAAYDGGSHALLVAALPLSAIWLLTTRRPLDQKTSLATALLIGYFAVIVLAGQAMGFLLA